MFGDDAAAGEIVDRLDAAVEFLEARVRDRAVRILERAKKPMTDLERINADEIAELARLGEPDAVRRTLRCRHDWRIADVHIDRCARCGQERRI